MAGVDIKANLRLSLIEHLISFVTMCQVPSEINDDYLYRLNSRIQNLILSGVKIILCGFKTMDKVLETDTSEEVTTEEKNSWRCYF